VSNGVGRKAHPFSSRHMDIKKPGSARFFFAAENAGYSSGNIICPENLSPVLWKPIIGRLSNSDRGASGVGVMLKVTRQDFSTH